MKRQIELLAPAKNKDIGIAAIRHGADAVYIGAPAFGARSAAGNSLAHIKELADFAHLYHAKVYVTLNTILSDSELNPALQLIEELYDIGVDALIVQDAALFQLPLPPIDLHASTQMDNVDAEKVRFLEDIGCSQVVLARELSLAEIAEIHKSCKVKLEAFVHGALCVSYSGRCYASEHCFHRSANRGFCAQFCRLPFTLLDGNGDVVEKDRHLLSLRDMNRSDSLEAMLDAGISSFKIEGRLKDENYVKNVTAFYRQALDEIILRRPEDFERSSQGHEHFTFTPQLAKSFNRGFTDYFLHGKRTAMHNFLTPKSMGEEAGCVVDIGKKHLETDGKLTFAPGDGLVFADKNGRLQGFRVNSVEGRRIFPHIMPKFSCGTMLFRNHDEAFSKQLARPSAERKIDLYAEFSESLDGFLLTFTDAYGISVSHHFSLEKNIARTPQRENLEKQLSRLGDTIFQLKQLSVAFSANWFIPSSQLAAWRRECVENLLEAREKARPRGQRRPEKIGAKLPRTAYDYTANIYNNEARRFYEAHGAIDLAPAFELQPPAAPILMFTKHCLRHALGCCLKEGGEARLPSPLTLRLADGKTFRLDFDCKKCEMRILQIEE